MHELKALLKWKELHIVLWPQDQSWSGESKKLDWFQFLCGLKTPPFVCLARLTVHYRPLIPACMHNYENIRLQHSINLAQAKFSLSPPLLYLDGGGWANNYAWSKLPYCIVRYFRGVYISWTANSILVREKYIISRMEILNHASSHINLIIFQDFYFRG